MVCEIVNILGQSTPIGDCAVENKGSDTDTIPYGRGDDVYHSDKDFDPAPAF